MKYEKLIEQLINLRFVTDKHESHPEESTFHHVVQAYNIAKRESNDQDLHVAALFHDIGKLIDTFGHENFSLDILEAFGYYNEKVYWLIKNHMRIRWMLSGKLNKHGKIQKLLTSTWLPELVHLRRLDGISRVVGKRTEINMNEVNDLLIETGEYNENR